MGNFSAMPRPDHNVRTGSKFERTASLQGVLSRIVLSALDAGEAAVILLALKQRIPLVCIDEWKGRRMALASGLKVTGALGLLGRAKMQGIIPAVSPFIERVLRNGIRYHPALIRQVPQALGSKVL